ncbi:MAG: adenylate kinase family protein, partial [Gammaproteobacteria bacterium]
AQAQALDAMLRNLNQPLDCGVLIDVDFDVLMQRLAGRRNCENCGATYNIFTNPPRLDEQCDRCGATLHHRADDNEVTINNRLKVYDAQTKPLIEFYRGQGRLEIVNGVGEVDTIFKRLLAVLEPIAKGKRKPKLPPQPAVKPAKPAAPAKGKPAKIAIKSRMKPAKPKSKQASSKKPLVKQKAVTKKKPVAKRAKTVKHSPKKSRGRK